MTDPEEKYKQQLNVVEQKAELIDTISKILLKQPNKIIYFKNSKLLVEGDYLNAVFLNKINFVIVSNMEFRFPITNLNLQKLNELLEEINAAIPIKNKLIISLEKMEKNLNGGN